MIEMAAPWITEREIETVVECMRNGWDGPDKYWYCETFEREFARYHSRSHALMTTNCTSAIHLVLAGLGIGEGDEVIVPESTWIGSSAAISYVGAKPVFADVDAGHWCLTPESIEAKLTPRTKAVIAVDLYGNMPDWDALESHAAEHSYFLIEDAAEALGSVYRGRRAGGFGVASVFSFHRTKTLTTGEGGMLLTSDDALLARAKLLRDHGRMPFSYDVEEVAFKYMPFNLQAALGYAQFQRVGELVGKKREILEFYRRGLAGLPAVTLNPEPEGGQNGVWCTTAVFDRELNLNTDDMLAYLGERNIGARGFFAPLSSLGAYGARGREFEQINPVAYDLAGRGINLPSALNLTVPQLEAVVEAVHGMVASRL